MHVESLSLSPNNGAAATAAFRSRRVSNLNIISFYPLISGELLVPSTGVHCCPVRAVYLVSTWTATGVLVQYNNLALVGNQFCSR